MYFTKELKTESGSIIMLTYTATQGEDGWYGIHIINTATGESASVESLTPNRDEVLELLTIFSECGVTTITLRDVAYDWLSDKYTV